mmetsp:Transcript_8435/g.21087  ORF Transcript_8435/g.21087 Transcript_8435/m.21087 type:complete len:312 (-) Transcript_8435:13-948(-)
MQLLACSHKACACTPGSSKSHISKAQAPSKAQVQSGKAQPSQMQTPSQISPSKLPPWAAFRDAPVITTVSSTNASIHHPSDTISSCHCLLLFYLLFQISALMTQQTTARKWAGMRSHRPPIVAAAAATCAQPHIRCCMLAAQPACLHLQPPPPSNTAPPSILSSAFCHDASLVVLRSGQPLITPSCPSITPAPQYAYASRGYCKTSQRFYQSLPYVPITPAPTRCLSGSGLRRMQCMCKCAGARSPCSPPLYVAAAAPAWQQSMYTQAVQAHPQGQSACQEFQTLPLFKHPCSCKDLQLPRVACSPTHGPL